MTTYTIIPVEVSASTGFLGTPRDITIRVTGADGSRGPGGFGVVLTKDRGFVAYGLSAVISAVPLPSAEVIGLAPGDVVLLNGQLHEVGLSTDWLNRGLPTFTPVGVKVLSEHAIDTGGSA